MTDSRSKVAVVTGASAGIGEAITKVLLESGMIVVGLARRVEKIDKLAKDHEGKLYAVKADLSKQEDIHNAITWIHENVGPITVLINNAGVSIVKTIDVAEPEDITTVLNVNLVAATLFTQEAIKSMKTFKIDGTIININSIAGHHIKNFPGTSSYVASKFGLRGFTESIRAELAEAGSKIRITNLSPGLVETEMSRPIPGLIKTNVHLKPKDIADAVKYVLTLPQNVNIAELTIRPTGEKF